MSRVKDEMFTDKEPEDGFQVDPEYDKQVQTAPLRGIGAWTATTESKEIFKKMPAIMSDLGAIGKGQKNLQQGFKYRGIDDVYNAAHSVMATHGVFTTSKILMREREERKTANGRLLIYTILRIEYTFWASDGSSVSTVVDGEGMDSGDKSSNKAMAVAHKYALLQAFMVPTDDIKDPDAESHEVKPRTQRPTQSNFQKPTPNPDTIRALLACEDLPTLREMWGKLSKSDHRLYEGVKEQRKEELQKLSTVDQDIPQ